MSSAATVYQTLNLVAITCAALAGSTAARRRGLDVVGVLSCAVITGLGGGLLRDVLLQDGVLGTHHRAEAVERARTLGLLAPARTSHATTA